MKRTGFARAGASDQRDVLTRAHCQCRPMKHRPPGGVAEHDVLEKNRRPLRAVGRVARRRLRLFEGRGQGREDALGAGHRSLNGLPLFAERGDRLEDALQENQKRRQGAERDAERGERLARPGPQERGDRQRRQNRGHGRVERRIACRAVRCRQRVAEHPPKSADRLALSAEGANDLDASEILLQARGERPDGDSRGALRLADADLQEPERDHQRRRDERRHQGERGAEDGHARGQGHAAALDSPPGWRCPRRTRCRVPRRPRYTG